MKAEKTISFRVTKDMKSRLIKEKATIELREKKYMSLSEMIKTAINYFIENKNKGA